MSLEFSGICAGVRRRALLTGLALGGAALAACTAGGGEPAGRAPGAAALGQRRRAARDSAALLTRYEATAAAHPSLARTLTPLREGVAAHVTVLGEGDPAGPQSPAGSGEPMAEPGVPPAADRALAALADAERQLAGERLRTLAAAPPELARLLASLAAAGWASAHLLSEARP